MITDIGQRLGRDIKFDIVLAESSFENADMIMAYYRQQHPKTLVVGLDRPSNKLRFPDKLCHMAWPLPPPRSDATLKVRLDNAFSVVRQNGALDV